MKKRLYDFTKANAIITLIAYAFLITLTCFSLVNDGKLNIVSLIVLILLIISLILIIWYFVFMAIKVTEQGIFHGKKFIHIKDCKYIVEYNRRFKVTEIILYNKYDKIDSMDKIERKKKMIVVQHSKQYEDFLNDYIKSKNKGEKHEANK